MQNQDNLAKSYQLAMVEEHSFQGVVLKNMCHSLVNLEHAHDRDLDQISFTRDLGSGKQARAEYQHAAMVCTSFFFWAFFFACLFLLLVPAFEVLLSLFSGLADQGLVARCFSVLGAWVLGTEETMWYTTRD